jgi:hypothetical protein
MTLELPIELQNIWKSPKIPLFVGFIDMKKKKIYKLKLTLMVGLVLRRKMKIFC